MIIAVGFKVNSERAVQFRKWVNQIAKDYTIKGWVMDDERLKRGTYLTEKYFDEQLERIREIRASERKFYQKITDLYATAIDYDKNSATTRRFYATVQNKMHYAVHGHTAAELIVERADHTKEHMGLTTWADAPEGKIKKSDVTVAKNYLSRETNPLTVEVRMEVETGEVKEHPTYKRIQEYVQEKYGFKVHTAYIAEVKRMVGLDMHKAPNAVEQRKHEYHPCPPEKVEAIKDALRHFGLISE